MVQHPPLYYWMEAAVLRMPGVSGLAWDLQVWIMRLLSVVLMLPVPLLCWATARRLLTATSGGAAMDPERASRLAVLAAVVPLSVPNMIRDGSSVTNDTLLILTTSVVLYLVSRVMTGDLSRRTAAWLAVALAAALLTKGLALVLPLVILAAYLIAGRRQRPPPPRSRAVGVPLLIVAVGAVVGGLWWLRNLIEYGTVQVDGFGAAQTRVLYGTPDHKGTLLHFIPAFTSGFISRIWGGIGIPDTPNPGPIIVYGWFIVVLVGVVGALVVKGRAGERLGALVLIATSVLTFGVVAEGSLSVFRQWSDHLSAEQGRYLYSTVVAGGGPGRSGMDPDDPSSRAHRTGTDRADRSGGHQCRGLADDHADLVPAGYPAASHPRSAGRDPRSPSVVAVARTGHGVAGDGAPGRHRGSGGSGRWWPTPTDSVVPWTRTLVTVTGPTPPFRSSPESTGRRPSTRAGQCVEALPATGSTGTVATTGSTGSTTVSLDERANRSRFCISNASSVNTRLIRMRSAITPSATDRGAGDHQDATDQQGLDVP